MPRRIGRALLLTACMVLLLCLLTVGANAYSYPSMPSDWKNVQVTVGDVTMPFSRYPSGSTFSGSKSTMTVSEAKDYGLTLRSELNLRGWECVGFARYAYAALFYKYPQDASIDTTLAYEYSTNYAYRNMISEVLGSRTLGGGYSASTLRTLITACQPGAVMRISGHSMVIMAIYDDGLLIYDNNFSGTNQVNVRAYTWQSFVNSLGARGIEALQMPAYYPGYSYSIGDNTYYPIDTANAGSYVVYNCNQVNVRISPTVNSTQVGTIPMGTSVYVHGTYNGWAQITYENKNRWVSLDYVRFPVSATFDGNGATPSFTSYTYSAGKTFGTMPTVRKTSRTLLGWSSGSTLYTSSSVVPAVSTLALKAQWCILNFQDVLDTAYYAEPVLWAANKGITNGTSATTFSPEDSCTRGQMVTFLWRAVGSPNPTSYRNPFSDVSSGAYFYKAVLWAVEKGITNGISATQFAPDATCTRAQAVTFLWRLAGEPKISAANPFRDVGADLYYTNAVLWAVKNSITNGTTATTFSPDDNCTRGQTVTFLYRDLK